MGFLPLLGDGLALSLPSVLEVAAEFIPEHEDNTGGHVLLSRLGPQPEVARHFLETERGGGGGKQTRMCMRMMKMMMMMVTMTFLSSKQHFRHLTEKTLLESTQQKMGKLCDKEFDSVEGTYCKTCN